MRVPLFSRRAEKNRREKLPAYINVEKFARIRRNTRREKTAPLSTPSLASLASYLEC